RDEDYGSGNVKGEDGEQREKAATGDSGLSLEEKGKSGTETNAAVDLEKVEKDRLESLQSWIVRRSPIDAQDLILMTARGKQVKQQTLSLEGEIYAYDRQILSASPHASLSSSLPTTAAPDRYEPRAAPEGPTDKKSAESWRRLFEARVSWAEEIRNRCTDIAKQTRQVDAEAAVIQRSTAIAVENAKQHIGNLRPKYEDSKIWAENVLQDQTFLLEQEDVVLSKYPAIPAIRALGACLSGTTHLPEDNDRTSSSHLEASLDTFVDMAEIKSASSAGRLSSQRFKHRTNELNVAFDDVVQKATSIVDNFSRDATLLDDAMAEQGDHLLEEIQVISNKIAADRDHILRLPKGSDAVAQMSRIALLHARDFIPSLCQTARELDDLVQKSVERKNEAQRSGVQYLQNISTLESRLGHVHKKMANLDVDPDDGQAFETLGTVTRLPTVYGLLLVECVRRLEWTDKITADSSTLVEEMAIFKEEEFKRRRKWVKEMEGAVDLGALDDMSLKIDINVQADKQHWPKASRADVQKYIATLQRLQGFDEAIKEVSAAFATLDKPTKQQTRRAKAFKNGSIHDTNYGRNSLLLRGDDDMLNALKGEKTKLEDKLKSSESRIRKLEDLLHRQSQVSRPSSSGNPFSVQPPSVERHNTSPVIGFPTSLPKPFDSVSRRSSTSSKRISAHAEPDDKSLSKRIASLEAELAAEKVRSSKFEKDAAARLNAEDNLKAQVQEAISTKEDLLGNFEAQKKEFEDERRHLEEENLKVKTRLEETEDELDRVLGSQDHGARELALEEELQRIRDEAERDVREAQAQTEVLRGEHQDLQEVQAKMSKETKKLRDEMLVLEVKRKDQRTSLNSALLFLDPESHSSSDLDGSIDAINAALRRHKNGHDELKRLLETTRTENADLSSHLDSHNVELANLRDRLGNEEMEVFSTRESLAMCREDLKRVQAEMSKESHDHNDLKTQHQAAKAEVEALESRVQGFESRMQNLQDDNDQSTQSYANLGDRAERITQILYTQTSTLHKLLEQIGYTVTRSLDSPMTVHKTPKASSTTSTLLSSSGPLPSKTLTAESTPNILPDYVTSWATSNPSSHQPSLFNTLTTDLSTFTLPTFTDTIVKRVKDAEHLARKWQREARSYREKAHRFQNESQHKIAYRSFKEGDLALFLPTRNQKTRPWAAFNIGAPHYFLRECEGHGLRSRDWLLARIGRIEERVVDLRGGVSNGAVTNTEEITTGDTDQKALNGEAEDPGANNDNNDANPFALSDGLRWYLLDAAEERPGAPINVGLGKATVAAASVDAKGSSVRIRKSEDMGAGAGMDGEGVRERLTRSLDSRRSSTGSRKEKGGQGNGGAGAGAGAGGAGVEVSSIEATRPNSKAGNGDGDGREKERERQEALEVSKNLLWAP
ncbi:MAG: hypothetical protein Q9174_003591, partial [Haloplaca sp. 1 TL-2023]